MISPRYTLILTFTMNQIIHIFCDSSESYCEMSSHMCEEDFKEEGVSPELAEETSCDTQTNAMAIVPYDDSVISPFHKAERQFKFDNDLYTFFVTIKQNWQEGGVAAVVWEAAIVLAEYLTKNADIVKGKKVIELGAGTGLAGIAAAYLGADVTLTDRATAQKTLKENIILNQQHHREINITNQILEWGKDLNKFDTYDVILGADIVYIEDTFEDLIKTLLHLCSAKSIILLTSKIRYSRDTRFYDLLKKDFNIKEILHDSQMDIYLYQGNSK